MPVADQIASCPEMWLYSTSHIHRGPMVKIDIARKLHRQEGIHVREAEQLINHLIEIIKETLDLEEVRRF